MNRKLEAVLGTSVKPHVALIQDWDARWALDASSGPSNCNKKYVETCHAHYRPFWEAGVPVDVIESTAPSMGTA